METRLIFAYLLIALMAAAFSLWGVMAARKRRVHRRLMQGWRD